MKIVFDCNVLVSFLISAGETISFIFQLWEKNYFLVFITDEIEQEIFSVINRLVDKKYINKKDALIFLEFLEGNTIKIKSYSRLELSKDKKDNRYLNCAKDAGVDYLVTGDKKHLLLLKIIGGTKIISAKELIKIIKEKN